MDKGGGLGRKIVWMFQDGKTLLGAAATITLGVCTVFCSAGLSKMVDTPPLTPAVSAVVVIWAEETMTMTMEEAVKMVSVSKYIHATSSLYLHLLTVVHRCH
jgi:hypothetical protein